MKRLAILALSLTLPALGLAKDFNFTYLQAQYQDHKSSDFFGDGKAKPAYLTLSYETQGVVFQAHYGYGAVDQIGGINLSDTNMTEYGLFLGGAAQHSSKTALIGGFALNFGKLKPGSQDSAIFTTGYPDDIKSYNDYSVKGGVRHWLFSMLELDIDGALTLRDYGGKDVSGNGTRDQLGNVGLGLRLQPFHMFSIGVGANYVHTLSPGPRGTWNDQVFTGDLRYQF